MEEANTPREMETSLSHIGSSGDAGQIPKSKWVRSCETSFERESDGMVMAGKLVSAEKIRRTHQGHNIEGDSTHLREVRDGEQVVKEILEEVQHRKQQLEDEGRQYGMYEGLHLLVGVEKENIRDFARKKRSRAVTLKRTILEHDFY